MKWFQHDTDSSEDVKMLRLEEVYGNDGYALYFKCLEIVGKEGTAGKLSFKKFPKELIARRSHLSVERVGLILGYMASVNLCNGKSLASGTLYFPRFKERSDTYTKRVQRSAEQGSNNVPLNKKILDNITEYYIKKKGYVGRPSAFELRSVYGGAGTLLKRTGGDVVKAMASIDWVSEQTYIDWTLFTCVKKYSDFEKTVKTDNVLKLEASLNE